MNSKLSIINYQLRIAWLYPDLMSTYGDRGNIITLLKRCEWRGIKVEIIPISADANKQQLKTSDLIFMGGGEDKQQKIVAKDLKNEEAEVLKQMIYQGIPGLYICGAYQFLGKYYKEADGTIISGLNILDLYTQNPGVNHKRLIGNIAVEANEFLSDILIGFENHGGRTYLGEEVKPLGKVLKGSGNNGDDQTEGAVYKNTFCTYLHGPILPKNPGFADLLIQKALEVKYRQKIILDKLDDSLEEAARSSIAKKLNIEL